MSTRRPSSEAKTAKVEAGLVVSIDPASPGKLTLSTQATTAVSPASSAARAESSQA